MYVLDRCDGTSPIKIRLLVTKEHSYDKWGLLIEAGSIRRTYGGHVACRLCGGGMPDVKTLIELATNAPEYLLQPGRGGCMAFLPRKAVRIKQERAARVVSQKAVAQ